MDDLVSVQEIWQKRAAVAKECGEELTILRDDLNAVLSRNYFGDGCLEGLDAFEALRNVVDEGADRLLRMGLQSVRLARSSIRASTELAAEDAKGAEWLD